MKKILLLVLFLFALHTFASTGPDTTAQAKKQTDTLKTNDTLRPIVAPAFDVANVKGEIDLDKNHYQVLNTGLKELSINNVTSAAYSGKFAYNPISPKFNPGSAKEIERFIKLFNLHNSWVRFKLTNTGSTDKRLFVTCNSGEDSFYIFDGKNYKTYKNGWMRAFPEKQGDKNSNYIPVTVKPGTEVVVYVHTRISLLKPRIQDYDVFISENYTQELLFDREDIIGFGFAGFILFAIVFNLFFYYINREKLYLNYSVLLFFIGGLSAWQPTINLWFPSAIRYSVAIVIFLWGGFYIYFIRTFELFLDIRQYYPKWIKFLKYFCWISAVVIFISAMLVVELEFNFDQSLRLLGFISFCIMAIFAVATVALIAFIVILIKTLIKLKKRKDPEAKIIFWALLPYFATYLFVNEDVELLMAMWGAALLSWGMFARFKRLQDGYAEQVVEKERITREKEEEKNALIAQQNIRLEQLVEERTADLEKSLAELRQTQDQLIQSEKMASLGELTAGIAHEIQNPLNFVNNFSDVSIELLDEMEEELDKGDIEEVKAISGDIKQNLEKIAHHGRRADGIVKGMLQHSRASSGQKEPTDVNALADEYLRLAYHGLRAKDKSFNADLVTHFDPSLPKVNVVPQDVGRVLLNLFTNAFYATNEKQKSPPATTGEDAAVYKPKVEVTTKQVGSAIEISVKDNGTGIPDAVKDKILQPFFTTKPTGQGTGLGLSLSYDIIVKGHGGTINIESTEGEWAEFIISLPIV